ncbi:hypothetical protein [uncultured Devosia sp.]|uniref:hypothetical protein n=1 Tax=uncultured Devosia sp. TaxID=211434 RepID=UPI0035CC4487
MLWIEQTLDATRATANAAIVANRKQLRPYLSVPKAWVDKDGVTVWAEIQNSGQTPAFSVLVQTEWYQIGTHSVSEDQVPFGMVGPNSKRVHASRLRVAIGTGSTSYNPIVGITLIYSESAAGSDGRATWQSATKFFFASFHPLERDKFTLFHRAGSGDEEQMS